MSKPVQAFVSFLLAGVVGASAHGLIQDPPSRQWICGAQTKPNEIEFGEAKTPACSTAFAINPLAAYNFMAVVTHSWGRSEVTPLPAHVCGFAGEFWKGAETPWDVPMQWPANPMTAGPRTFTWNISWGPHFDDTKEFKYWITKADFKFSPTKALTWDDFETEPFCVLEYDDKNPKANPDVEADKGMNVFKTRCNVPQRDGHHVIYGEWGRTEPTIERFHGCVDAAFGTTAVTPREGMGPRPGAAAAKGIQGGRSDALGRTGKKGAGFLLPVPKTSKP
jgi:chitin-binding protein